MTSFRELKNNNDLRRLQADLATHKGGAVLLDKPTLDAMKAKALNTAQLYLDRQGKIHNEDQSYAMDLVRAEVQRVGPAAVDVEAVRALALRVTQANRKQRWLEVKALFAELKVKEVPDDYVWAARQSGVELFDAPPTVLVPDPPEEIGAANSPKPE